MPIHLFNPLIHINKLRLQLWPCHISKYKNFFSTTSSVIPDNNPSEIINLTKTANKIKCCNNNNIPLVVELGQATRWTHQHLFDEHNADDQVTPGLDRQEFARRRDNYVKLLTEYQSAYFKSKSNNGSMTTCGSSNFMAIIPSAMTSFLGPDVPHMFKQNSDFMYLTGFNEPNSVLVISKTDADPDSSYKTTIFVKEQNEKTALWEGPCTGPNNILKLCGIETAYAADEFTIFLNSLLKDTHRFGKIALWRYPYEFVRSESGPDCENSQIENELNAFVNETQSSSKLIDMSEQPSLNNSIAASYYNSSRYFVQLCRVRKSEAELVIMREACDISSSAFKNSMTLAHPHINEHLIHAKFTFDCQVRGADRLAYIPVIAGGNRATTLHYIRNNQLVGNNQLLLMDAGCEYRHYASDITRTWPVSGKFTAAQKELYEACLNVQMFCIGHCVPGVTLQELYCLMMVKLGEELKKLGLIDKKLYESISNSKQASHLPMHYIQALSKFCPHDIGHYLGLDVHDSPEVTKQLKLEPGSVITIEPGIYIRADDMGVAEKYRGIGIRIEDDVVITSSGCEVLSKNTPKTIDELENIFLKR